MEARPPRVRRKSSAIKLSLSRASGSGFIPPDEADAFVPEEMSEQVSIYSTRSGGVGSQLSIPNLPPAGSALSITLESLRITVEKRISSLAYLKRAHSGDLYWFNTVKLASEDLKIVFEPGRMRSRTTRFAVLGMSLSSLLDITAAHDFLRGLLSLVQEFEAVPDDKFDRRNQKNLFRNNSKSRKSTGGADLSMGIQDTGDASFLFTPNIPYELDYFQVFLTACDMLIETYQKILFHLGPSISNSSSGFPQPPTGPGRTTPVERTATVGLSPALADVVLKIDARLKKLIALVTKELDAHARAAIKTELSSLGQADWGMEWGDGGLSLPPASNLLPPTFLQAHVTSKPQRARSIMDTHLIATVNKLQDAFASSGLSSNPIDLPQIAVIGSQSSGKSSVLENIVGRDFLPRGTGIVTRRPLVLQLINRPASPKKAGEEEDGSKPTSDKASNPDEWAEFLHRPGEKFFDFNKVRDEIVADTELKTGKNAGISPLPIGLRIFSPNVLTLTLIDLPGLTKVPVGDQPRDIERQIREMLLKFIMKPNSIILAVTAANTDLANSDGLKMARECDPEGTRTIGVLTKVDLMDQGTDVVDILAGRIIPLRLGYVPVVNRGQRDIDNKRPIAAALEHEKQFFENHASYRSKAAYCGTPYLTKRLNTILMHHIKSTLPDIKQKISQNLTKYEQELASLGGPSGEGNNGNVILQIITEFCAEFRTAIDGNSGDLSLNELSGGARISFVFHELFSNGVKSLDPYDQVKDADIRTILYNSSGSSPALFVGTTAFEVIIKQQIKRIEEPSLKCAGLVYDELMRILNQLLTKNQTFKRYPALRDRFYSTVQNFYRKSMIPTNKLVTDLVNMESSYINTGHPDFISGHKAMALVSERMNANKPAPPTHDPKTGKLAPGTLNNGRDLDSDLKKEEGFFGSFWPGGKKPASSATRKGAAAMEAPPQVLRASGTLSERETMETEVIKLLISSYFSLSKRTLIDMVPKAIMLNLVFHAKDDLQRELLGELYKPDVIEDILKESDSVVTRRKECIKMIAALTKSEAICASVG